MDARPLPVSLLDRALFCPRSMYALVADGFLPRLQEAGYGTFARRHVFERLREIVRWAETADKPWVASAMFLALYATFDEVQATVNECEFAAFSWASDEALGRVHSCVFNRVNDLQTTGFEPGNAPALLEAFMRVMRTALGGRDPRALSFPEPDPKELMTRHSAAVRQRAAEKAAVKPGAAATPSAGPKRKAAPNSVTPERAVERAYPPELVVETSRVRERARIFETAVDYGDVAAVDALGQATRFLPFPRGTLERPPKRARFADVEGVD